MLLSHMFVNQLITDFMCFYNSNIYSNNIISKNKFSLTVHTIIQQAAVCSKNQLYWSMDTYLMGWQISLISKGQEANKKNSDFMSSYVCNKTYCREFHPGVTPFSRAKGSKVILGKYRHVCSFLPYKGFQKLTEWPGKDHSWWQSWSSVILKIP